MIIKKLFHNNKNNKFYKDSIYNNIFLCQHNSCQDQPQVEHETFQLNARPCGLAAKNLFPEKKIKDFEI